MATNAKKAHATPSLSLGARRTVRRSAASLITASQRATDRFVDVTTRRVPCALGAYFGAKGLRLVLNIATAALVVVLPYTAATSVRADASPADVASPSFAAVPTEVVARAQTAARSVVAGARSPMTVAAEETRPVIVRKIAKDDTLSTMANYYAISLEALAYANAIAEEDQSLALGGELVIPPGEGALYKVREGDSVEAVASRFKVDPAVVMSYNRMYFEPERFAPGQLIFVPGAVLPALKRTERPRAIAMPASARIPARTGRLGLPVNGIFTQYFWWGHSGVDIAAPYGTGIGASDDGIVVATGPVPVGGLRVCVQHAGGLETCYYHTSAVYVSPGQTVVRGQLIAAIGLTGVTTGPHVHWELKVNGVPQNPLAY
ncbi:MAG TPA: peptidoglycan DD-metalloendopeptidase family protein [Candidatus Limnocylindria bacterium]|nr:peptidoglycan DD-metalloendopeptidase family protein [Candidatus Limnocylindria bacterium]